MIFKRLTFLLIFLKSATVYAQTPSADNTIYVNINVNGGTGSGNSWANAIPQLADALKWAHQQRNNNIWTIANPLKIYVARGLYLPLYTPEDGQNFTANPNRARDKAFLMVNHVKLYGGFAGSETSLGQRDLALASNKTTLSGDIGTLNDKSDNTSHVVVSSGAVGLAELNGFTITGANGNDPGSTIRVDGRQAPRNYGGGMLNLNSSPTVAHVIFTGNHSGGGGGMNNTTTSSPKISHVTFLENTATNGGAMENSSTSSPIVTHSVFRGNSAGRGGGIVNTDGSLLLIINSVITGNNATQNAGAIRNSSRAHAIIINSVISGNKSSIYGAISNEESSLDVRNSIIMGNSEGIVDVFGETLTVLYSLVQDRTTTANGNLDATGVTAAQIFSDAPAFGTAPFLGGDYTLLPGSPVINKGDKTVFDAGKSPDLSAITTDLAGNPRVFGTQIDLGAYELQSTPVLPVGLVDFTAKKQSFGAVLNWKTASETNNKGFIIRRRTASDGFVVLGGVSGQGSGSVYSFEDPKPLKGTNYYQLQQQDLDGTITDLGIRSLDFDLIALELSAYPNPTKDHVTLSFTSNVFEFFALSDLSGKTLQNKKLLPGSTSLVVSMATLPVGIYLITLTGSDGKKVVKVVKH